MKKKAKEGVPHLTGGVKFDRALQELPEQRVRPETPDALFYYYLYIYKYRRDYSVNMRSAQGIHA